LLAAPFVRLTPADPFMLPDLACLLGTLWLSCGLSRFLLDETRLDEIRLGVPLCCCVFLLTTVLPVQVPKPVGVLPPVESAVSVPGHGDGVVPVVDGTAVTADGRTFHSGFDFVIYDADGVLRIVPLRPLPPVDTRLKLSDAAVVERGVRPHPERQTIGWSLPRPFGSAP